MTIPVIGLAQAPIGTISGTVTDESGGVIPNPKITISNADTGLTRTLTANADGTFSASALPAGTYQVRAEAQGFRTVERQATVLTGAVVSVNMSMPVGATREVVTVEGEAPQINYETQAIGGVVTQRQIQNLPLNGRSFLQLAFLEPGVTVSPSSTSQYNALFSVNILGADDDQTRVTVDGSSVVNLIEGGTQQNFSQEVVQEFQIATTNFDLSTGITGAGAINIVTRGGTNDFHGGGYFFFRDHNMAAYPGLSRDPSNSDPFFARRQSGFLIGGPIKKDRLFFFTNLEHTNQNGVVSVQPLLPEFAHFGTIAGTPYIGNQVTARVDNRISQKHSWFMRYSHDGNHAIGPRGSGSSFPSNWLKNTNWADQSIGSLTSAFRPNLVNDFRFSYTYWHNRNLFLSKSECPGDCIGLGLPQIDIDGAGFTIGDTTNAPQGRDLRRFITSDDVTWQKGSHRLRFGGEWDANIGTGFWAFEEPAASVLYSPAEVRLYNSFVPAQLRIPIPSSFNSIQDILKLPLAAFEMGVGDPSQPPLYNINHAKSDHRIHLYAQDTWKVTPRFTLNYGLGWSYESNLLNHDLTKPQYLAPLLGANGLGKERHDGNNFSPAMGFAWNVSNDNKTVVRGGAGIFYNSFDIYKRLIERSIIGPRGNGRFPIPGSFVPNPIPGIPGVPPGTPLEFTNGPTYFNGALMLAILDPVRAAIQQQLGDPHATDLTIRNIQIFKTGSDLLTEHFPTPYSEHFSVGVQRQLTQNLVLQADFVFRQFMKEEMGNIDYNHWNQVGGPVMAVCGGADALNPFAACSNGPIEVRTPAGRDHYKALLTKLSKRFSGRFELSAAYAYQSQVGFNGIDNNDNWFESWGPKSPRHVLNVAGIVDLPWGFQASFISESASRGPFNVKISGLDFNGDGTNGDRLPGSTHNEFNFGAGKSDLARLIEQFNQNYAGKKTPRGQDIPTLVPPSNYNFGDGFSSQDLRLTKIFKFRERYKLHMFGEVFNLFNIANLSGYSGNIREPSFGQPTNRVQQVFGSGGPRAFQLGARVQF